MPTTAACFAETLELPHWIQLCIISREDFVLIQTALGHYGWMLSIEIGNGEMNSRG